MKWWTRLMAMPHVARHLIPVVVTTGVVTLAVSCIHSWRPRSPLHKPPAADAGTVGESGTALGPAACIVLVSMMSSRCEPCLSRALSLCCDRSKRWHPVDVGHCFLLGCDLPWMLSCFWRLWQSDTGRSLLWSCARWFVSVHGRCWCSLLTCDAV